MCFFEAQDAAGAAFKPQRSAERQIGEPMKCRSSADSSHFCVRRTQKFLDEILIKKRLTFKMSLKH